MPFAAALSQHPLATHAVGEVVGQVLETLGDEIDAAVFFVGAPFAGATEDIAAAVQATLRPGALIGATAAGVLGGGREVEGEAAISLLAFRSDAGSLRGATSIAIDGAGSRDQTARAIDAVGPGPGSALVLLADPFSFAAEDFLAWVGERWPDLAVVGGFASAATGPNGNRLVAGDLVTASGAVGLLLPASAGARAVVSQGARPIGDPLVVTKAWGSMIDEIAGQPALDLVMALAERVEPAERALMGRSLHLGVVIDEHQATFDRGDFWVRPVLGGDRERCSVAVPGEVAVGSTVQFEVRDPVTADEDLRYLLADVGGEGALVFSCTGRGQGLFGYPHHDAGAVSKQLDHGAVAGMFCAGEIGPIGGRNLLHALSATILVIGAEA